MPRLTPQQEIDREMEKLKAMGITMSVNLGRGGSEPRVASVLKAAAKDHGIHYGEPDDEMGVESGPDDVKDGRPF